MSENSSPPVPRGAVALPGRALLRFTGADSRRYLNGQVTNDVARAGAGAAIYACVTDGKGKLVADVYVRGFGEDGYLVDGPGDVREVLGARLERYIIADEVEVEDVTERYALFHVLGEVEPEGGGGVEWVGRCERFGVPGWDMVTAVGEAEEMRARLLGGSGFVSEDVLEAFRISRGVAVWGKELEPGILPPEARMEGRAIDYEKGCYVGQEVISRIRSAGRVNRLLWGLRACEGRFDAGDLLFSEGADGVVEEVGRVTSAAWVGEVRIGLGYVKRVASEAGRRLSCGVDENSLFSVVEIREIHDPPLG